MSKSFEIYEVLTVSYNICISKCHQRLEIENVVLSVNVRGVFNDYI